MQMETTTWTHLANTRAVRWETQLTSLRKLNLLTLGREQTAAWRTIWQSLGNRSGIQSNISIPWLIQGAWKHMTTLHKASRRFSIAMWLRAKRWNHSNKCPLAAGRINSLLQQYGEILFRHKEELNTKILVHATKRYLENKLSERSRQG